MKKYPVTQRTKHKQMKAIIGTAAACLLSVISDRKLVVTFVSTAPLHLSSWIDC